MSLNESDKVGHYIEMWKQTVTVQQHFNDIEWRIRGLALTALTFALGAAAVASKDGTTFGGVSLGAIVLVVGLLLWYAFYFVDRYWYHPLLKASVDQGHEVEDRIAEFLPGAALTRAITAGSPVRRPKVIWALGLFRADRTDELHSDDKLVWFYKLGMIALVLAALAFQVGSMFYEAPDEPTQVVVNLNETSRSSSPTPTDAPSLTAHPSEYPSATPSG